jgi:hypothetical protein
MTTCRIIQNNNSNVSLVPVREYLNMEDQMEEILKENKGKAGRVINILCIEKTIPKKAKQKWVLLISSG